MDEVQGCLSRRDVLIASAGSDIAAGFSDRLLRIRAELDPANENDDSIYRYDRVGLLCALSRRAAQRGRNGR